MRDHTDEPQGDHDEPEGGWVTAPVLYDTELVTTMLCRFTGFPAEASRRCLERENGQHPDVECRALYIQADALRAGQFDLSGFDEIPEEVRRPFVGDDLSGRPHG